MYQSALIGRSADRRGLSLIELVMVLLVLAILAGIVLPLLGGVNAIATPGGSKSDRRIVTETSMQSIRDAILGTETRPGAWVDLGRQPKLFPTTPGLLASETHPTAAAFDPVTKIGWRGPYLRGAMRQGGGVNVFLDGWGNPITIFVPDINGDSIMDRDDIQFARMVSNGEDGVLDTLTQDTQNYIPGGADPTSALTLDECGDDVILFFFVADTRQ
ncbi:MAG: prepilin-type N-terminal cleavage/methylation domain-containing protein [Planctomycetota bacterium]